MGGGGATSNAQSVGSFSSQNNANAQNASDSNPQNGANSQILVGANPSILKSGQIDNDINTYQLGAVEITAPREVDYNPSVTTITAKDIKNSGSENIEHALRSSSIGFVKNTYWEGAVSIRGFGHKQIGIYMDGIPVMSIYDRRTDYSQYTTQGISNIQVSKGFTSPIYGINQMGGAINIISAKPKKEFEFSLNAKYLEPDEVRSGVSVGTNQGTYYLQLDYSLLRRNTYPLSRDYKGTAQEAPKGYKKNAYYKNSTAKIKIGWRPNENHEYSLNYINERGKKNSLSTDTATTRSDSPYFNKDTVYLLGNSYFTPNLSLNTRLYYDTFHNSLDMYSANEASPWYRSIYDDSTYGGILTLNYDIYKDANFKFGANVKRDRHYALDIHATRGGVTATDSGIVAGDVSELTSSIFAQYAQRLWNFRLVLAGSYDRLDSLNAQNTNIGYQDGVVGVTSNEKTSIKGDFSAQGVLYYDFSDKHSLHFTLGKKQNMPSLQNRYSTVWGNYAINPNLKVESAIIYEMGYDLNFDKTKFNIALFYNDMTDMVVSRSGLDSSLCPDPATTGCNQYVNTNTGYAYGGDISIEQDLFDELLVVGANYTYTQKKAKGLSSDNTSYGTRMTDYPNHIFHAKIAVKPSKKAQIIGLSTLESARYYTGTNGYVRNNNYFTLDLSANYAFTKKLTLNAGVLNLTDRDNFIYFRGNLRLEGRRFFIGFDYDY